MIDAKGARSSATLLGCVPDEWTLRRRFLAINAGSSIARRIGFATTAERDSFLIPRRCDPRNRSESPRRHRRRTRQCSSAWWGTLSPREPIFVRTVTRLRSTLCT